MARNSADVIEQAIDEALRASDDSSDARHELPLTAAENPHWDDDKEATYAADFDQLAPWHVPDLSESDSQEWEEAKTSYFERTANFELLDSKFVTEYTDRLPGGLRDLVASNAEVASRDRKSGVRETPRVSPAPRSLEAPAANSFDREHSEHFAYQVSPSLRRSKPAPAPAPAALQPEPLEFDEASVATARGGRRFAPQRATAPQPTAAEFGALPLRPTLRSPAARNASWPPAPRSEAQGLAVFEAPAPVSSQVPTRPSRPSHPGALPVSSGFDADLAEIRAARRGQAATWVWFAASALAGVALVLAVRAWTTGTLMVREPAQPSVALETTVNAAAQPADTGFSITSVPEGAQIIVDGRATGFVTPAQIRSLSAGLHSVELKLAGHYDTSLPAVLKENSVLALEPVEMRAHVEEPQAVAAAPAAGALLPKLSAKESRLARRAARREAREARREAAKLRSVARNAPVRGLSSPEDRDATVTGEGTLRINSRPWARVLIDNKFVGNTPQRALSLPVGDHNVRLVNEPLNMSKSFRVTIRDGETVTRVELLSEDTEQSESQAQSGSSRQAYARR